MVGLHVDVDLDGDVDVDGDVVKGVNVNGVNVNGVNVKGVNVKGVNVNGVTSSPGRHVLPPRELVIVYAVDGIRGPPITWPRSPRLRSAPGSCSQRRNPC